MPLLFPVPLSLPENGANLKSRLAGLMPWRSGLSLLSGSLFCARLYLLHAMVMKDFLIALDFPQNPILFLTQQAVLVDFFWFSAW
ncbi:hypothetical protein AFE_2772 [Acidithiobacillus ferrooxidans ATCC 23270]|uniref:Uncharacterized protein n=1 Tax=Acidithiobacillus ferrooxidans (strain ATCC 23270 / DSM 14882 / CIP 104768 / NCIMB 8455) TaxID=243159 RepID=B7J8J8_ACIF2|nr:hypothetical protein AFE_2772 [Acidithiobacillus ferrooxidans ATCC 23270]